MYSVNIGEENFLVTRNEEGVLVNETPIPLEIKPLSGRKVHLMHENKSLEAELIHYDAESKSMLLRLGTKQVRMTIKDKNDLLLERLGLNIQASGAVKDIKAPMPGLILELKVKPGDEVKRGDVVLILEAMKMENSIKSPGEGVVTAIKVKLGQSVEKNQILIQF
ncbi:acyl-CoA carboxylase biotin carboxyl carrier protein subunit [Algoriphagus namhaensis]